MPIKYQIPYLIDENGCWNWQGKIQKNGYAGHVHRRYFVRFKGKIPEGNQIDHLCKNKICVNPEHLEAVSPTENVHRAISTKLTQEDIQKIRELQFKFTQCEIAKLFDINQGHVSRILNLKRWGDN